MKNQTSSWKTRQVHEKVGIKFWQLLIFELKLIKSFLILTLRLILTFISRIRTIATVCPVLSWLGLAWPVLFRPNLACPVLAWPVLAWPVLFRPNLACTVSVLTWLVLSNPVLFRPILSCPVLSYLILSNSVLFFSILSYSVLFSPIQSYSVLSCPVSSFPVLACPTTVLVYLIEVCRGPDEALVEGLRGSDQPGHLGTAGKLTIYKHLHTQNNRFGQKLEDRNQISKISQIQIFLGPRMTQKVYWWYY